MNKMERNWRRGRRLSYQMWAVFVVVGAIVMIYGCWGRHSYELVAGHIGVYAIGGRTSQGCLDLDAIGDTTLADSLLILVQAEPTVRDDGFRMRYAHKLTTFARADSVIGLELSLRDEVTGRILAEVDTVATVPPDGLREIFGPPLRWDPLTLQMRAFPDTMVSSEELVDTPLPVDCVTLFWASDVDVMKDHYNSDGMSSLALIVTGLAVVIPTNRLVSVVGESRWFVECTIERTYRNGQPAPQVTFRSRSFGG